MSATIEHRKLSIIDSLLETNNERILLLIEALLKSETDFWHLLSEKQKERIEKSIRDLNAGLGIPHENDMQEFRAN